MSLPPINTINQVFLEALLKGDRKICSEIAHEYVRENSIQKLYENLFRKSLYSVGDLWESNKISVATEHIASAIISAIQNELYSYILNQNAGEKSVIVCCTEGEQHQIGAKMVSDIFELSGYSSFFSGADTPVQALVHSVKEINPDFLAISQSLYFHFPRLEKKLEILNSEFPELKILIGGQAFLHGGQDILLKYKNVEFISDITSLELFLKNHK